MVVIMHNDGHQRLSTRSTIGNTYYIQFDSCLFALIQKAATTTRTKRHSTREGGSWYRFPVVSGVKSINLNRLREDQVPLLRGGGAIR
jgi:hypothetical protein